MEGSGKLDMQAGLTTVVEKAWHSFESAAESASRVTLAIPILFFGDLDAYPQVSAQGGHRRAESHHWRNSLRILHSCVSQQRRGLPSESTPDT